MKARARLGSLLRNLLCSALLAACAGCVKSPDDTAPLSAGHPLSQRSEHGLVEATVSLEGAQITRGANDLSITLQAAQGSSQPVLTHVDASMIAHGHSTSATNITADGDTFRVLDLDLYMSGRWQIELGVELDASSDVIDFALDVP
jgi:hypothetical protein